MKSGERVGKTMKNRVMKVCSCNDTRLTLFNNGIEIFKKICNDNYKFNIEGVYLINVVEKQIIPSINNKEKVYIVIRSRESKPGTLYSPNFKIKCELDDKLVHHILVLYTYLKNRSKFITHFIYGLDQYTNNSFDIIDNDDVNDDHSNGTNPDLTCYNIYEYNIRNMIFDENINTDRFDNLYFNIYFDRSNKIYYITDRELYKRIYSFIVRGVFLRKYFAVEDKITFDELERFYYFINNKKVSIQAVITMVFGGWSRYEDEYKKFVSYFVNLGGMISKFIDQDKNKITELDNDKKHPSISVKDITNIIEDEDRMMSPVDEDDETIK